MDTSSIVTRSQVQALPNIWSGFDNRILRTALNLLYYILATDVAPAAVSQYNRANHRDEQEDAWSLDL